MKLVKKQLAASLGGLPFGLLLAANPALADLQLNMPRGVTDISREVYGLHMLITWICVAIGVVVFGAILYSIIKFRKSKGAVPAQFHHSTTVEIVWTVIPMLILIGMAVPATTVLVDMYDTSKSDLTIKITGYQWKWGYEYLDEGVSFFSTLSQEDNYARQLNSGRNVAEVENYLLNVDEPVVVPVGKKIRFLLTSNDVIHAWWVPALGWKKDAIPGFINEAWTRINEPGTYRGQCAELCGRDHAFMPVVVKAVSEQEYQEWLQQKKAAAGAAAQPVQAGPSQQGVASAPATAPSAAGTSAGESGASQQQAEAAPAQAAALSMDELMAQGQKVYQAQCQSCHQAGGEGLPPAFKPIKGSPIATGPVAGHLEIVLKGKPGTGMMSFAHLSDQDLAAVITYERNAFGNNVGDMVQPADVKAAR